MGLGQLAERAVGEGDDGAVAVVGAGDGRGRSPSRSSSATSASRHEAARCRRAASARPWSRPDVGGVVAPSAGRRGQAQQHAGQHRERRRLEAERRGVGGQRVAGAAGGRRPPRASVRDLEQPDLAHPLEVGPHGVRVQAERLGDLGGGQRRAATGPARGRWRSGCCRPAPSARRGGATASVDRPQRRDYTAPTGRMRRARDDRARRRPTTSSALLRGVIDPELGSDIVDLGMVPAVDGRRRRRRRASPSSSPSPAARCGPRSRRTSRPASATTPACASVTHRLGRDDARGAHRGDAQGPLERPRARPRHRRPGDHPGAGHRRRARAASASARSPSTSPPPSPRRGFTVGVLDADIWGFSVPRMLGVDRAAWRPSAVDGSDRPLIIPNERRVGAGLLKVVSTGFLVDDEDTALMWRGLMLDQGGRALPPGRAPGATLDYLLIDMPPGTGDVQMGLARMLPRTELIIVTTPACRAQKVAIRAADMARRSFLRVAGVIENMSAFTCDHGDDATPLFGAGGGADAGRRDRRRRCSARCRSSRRSPPAATPASRSRSRRRAGGRRLPRHRRPDRHRDRARRSTWPAARPACSTPSKRRSARPRRH